MSRKAPSEGSGYEVGYGKPPVATRFKKGVSGNPRGRPKGSRGFNALLMEAMREKVIVTESGRRRAVSKLEVTFKQLVNKAAGGDPRATKLMLELVRVGEQEEAAKTLPAETPEERLARNKLFMQALRSRAAGGCDDGEG